MDITSWARNMQSSVTCLGNSRIDGKTMLRLDDTKKYLEILELGIDFKTKENKKKANIMDHFDKYVKALGEIITKPFCLHDLIVPEENPEF